MPLKPQLLRELSNRNEKVAEKRFCKMGYSVKWLDVQGPRSRPEFLVSDSKDPILVAEVKTVFSAGYLQDRNAHASTLDPSLIGSGVFRVGIDLREDILENAIGKYRCLIADRPEYDGLPFVVVLFYDQLADHFGLLPRRMEKYPEISGLLKVERDHAIRTVASRMSLDELEERINSGSMAGLPANTKEFRLLENECARVPLPDHFVAKCIVG